METTLCCYRFPASSLRRAPSLLSYRTTNPADVRHTVIQKIAPLYDHCQRIFPSYFIPPREFAVDETMVGFKGRSAWKTVIKGKPTPIGYKIYTVASHGYLINFDIYKGKGGYTSAQGVIHHTVVNLVTRWSREHRILFFDNLYTSPALCRHLLSIGIYSCGTVRPNRKGLPSNFKQVIKSLGKGEYRAWQSGQLGCLVWYDRQPVLMLSTHHIIDDMVTAPQDRGPNHPTTVLRPKVSIDYNLHKCHVDTVDQLRQYYSLQRKSIKSWPSLAWWLIDMCIINSYTLWCLDNNSQITQLQFRIALMDQLGDAYSSSHTHEQQTVPTDSSSHSDGHWPQRSEHRRNCVHCSIGRDHRIKTKYMCSLCNKHLCIEPCFRMYHIAQRIDNQEP